MANVDKAGLLELAGGEEEACELMQIFLQSAQNLLAGAREAVAQQNRADVGKAVHQMAGAAGSCGLEGLEHLCRELEAGLGEMAWSEMAQRLDHAADFLSDTEAEISVLFPEG